MSGPKRLAYLTGTRADFGLMEPILQSIAASPVLDLELVVTGMHLSDRFGRTERAVGASGLTIARRIEVAIDDDSGRGMGRAAGAVTGAMADYFHERSCDALVVLGDRGEMLAAAMAATFASLPIIHIAGGERSGSVDESIRHAISKLAHVHCVATQDSARRLIGMGEDPARIHEVGAPGLAGLLELAMVPLDELSDRYGFDAKAPYALLLFHPVVQDAVLAGAQWQALFDALSPTGLQIVCLLPNADHGTNAIRAAIIEQATRGNLVLVEHMARADYVTALRHARFLAGNSSSGIVEAASFATPVINVGDRQAGRLRSANVFDAGFTNGEIEAAIAQAQKFDGRGLINAYGEPHAHVLVRNLLEEIDLSDRTLLKKVMPY